MLGDSVSTILKPLDGVDAIEGVGAMDVIEAAVGRVVVDNVDNNGAEDGCKYSLVVVT